MNGKQLNATKWRGTWVRSPSLLSKQQLHCSTGAVFFLLPEVRIKSKITDGLVAQKLLLKESQWQIGDPWSRDPYARSLFALSNHNPSISVLVWRLFVMTEPKNPPSPTASPCIILLGCISGGSMGTPDFQRQYALLLTGLKVINLQLFMEGQHFGKSLLEILPFVAF